MKNITTRVLAGSVAIIAPLAAAVGILTSPAASAAGDSAVATIGLLEAQGFDVKIDRIGTLPLNQCTVTSVRNPQARTELVPVLGGRDNDRDFVPVIVKRTVSVSLDCTR